MMAVALGRLIPTMPLHHHHHHQPRRRSPVISANMRRRRHHRQRPLDLPNYDLDQYINDHEEEEEISGVGRAVLSALNSDTPPQLPVSESVVEEVAPGAVAMRGSDVLMALKRASVRKERKRKKRGVVAGGGGGGGGGGDGGGGAAESGEVRPVNVKSEWGKKLEELEWRLQEFLPSWCSERS